MTYRLYILDLADRKPDQGLYEFCEPRRIVLALGCDIITEYPPGDKLRQYVEFPTIEDAIAFKLKHL